MTEILRFCPNCGSRAAVEYCADDGVATFELKGGDPESAKLEPGALVAGKYRVIKLLGRGGFGAVYEAEHTGGLGRMALKLLALDQQDEDDVRRFYREAQVTAQLRHANTVRVFDVGQVKTGALFLAMELLRGKSLEDELKDRGKQGKVMAQGEAIDVACDVLRSLSEAHGSGLVHRDLKPANLMLTEVDGDLMTKVLDFGIAHVQDSSLTGTGRALGTPMYMSPEQCTGGPIDARSDLYALGIILYRCVTGKVPFGDPNPLTIMFAHISQPPPDLYASARTPINDAFAVALHKALAKDPGQRFANAREMRAALEAAKSQPLVETPEIGAETGDYPPRRAETPHLAAGTPSTHGYPSSAAAAQAAKSLGISGDFGRSGADLAQQQRLVVTIDEPLNAAVDVPDRTLDANTISDTPAPGIAAARPGPATPKRGATPVSHDHIGTAVVQSVAGSQAAAGEGSPSQHQPARHNWMIPAAIVGAAALLAIGWATARPAPQQTAAVAPATSAPIAQPAAVPVPAADQAAMAPAPQPAVVAAQSAAVAEIPKSATAVAQPAAVVPPQPVAVDPAAAAAAAAAPPRPKVRVGAEKARPAKPAKGLDDALPTD